MLFGRFLGFISTEINTEILPKNLSEGRFRSYWERIEKAGGNELTYTAVIKCLPWVRFEVGPLTQVPGDFAV